MSIEINPAIRTEIARRLVEQAAPGYSKDAQGEWYVVDGEAVVHCQANAAWKPWSDDADVISVEDLVEANAAQDNADFDPTPDGDVSEEDAFDAAVDFAESYIPTSYDAE